MVKYGINNPCNFGSCYWHFQGEGGAGLQYVDMTLQKYITARSHIRLLAWESFLFLHIEKHTTWRFQKFCGVAEPGLGFLISH